MTTVPEDIARGAAALHARRAMRVPIQKEAVAWAIDALSAGLDSPSLYILAGLQEPLYWSEVDDYFNRAIAELRLREPATKEAAIWAYASQTARDLRNDKSSAREAVAVLNQLCIALDYDRRLMPFYCLDDALADLDAGSDPWSYPDVSPSNFDETSKKEAEALLVALDSREDPKSFG